LISLFTNHPKKGRDRGHVPIFACVTVDLEKYRRGTPASDYTQRAAQYD